MHYLANAKRVTAELVNLASEIVTGSKAISSSYLTILDMREWLTPWNGQS